MKKFMYLVIAGDRRQYETWRYFYKGLSDYKDSRFIQFMDQFRGFSPKTTKIVLYGQYYRSRVYNDPSFEAYSNMYPVINWDGNPIEKPV